MKKKPAPKKPKKFDPLDSPQWISESSLRSANITEPPSDGSDSPGQKGLRFNAFPYYIVPCPGEAQTFSIYATATGEDAETATVEVFGPHDTYKRGTRAVVMDYEVRPIDYGTELDFSASATDRITQSLTRYCLGVKFLKMNFNKAKPAFAQYPEAPGPWTLYLEGEGGVGGVARFSIDCSFQVIPIVPSKIPGESTFAKCPFKFIVIQWVQGYTASQKVGAPVVETPQDGKEGVEQVVPLFDQHGVVSAEDFETLGDAAPKLCTIQIIENDGE